MADSQRLSALRGLQTALRAINTTDGYHYTVKSTSVILDRVDLATINPTDLPYICIFGPQPGERKKESGGRVGRVLETFRVNIQARVDADGTSEGRKTIAAENLLADLERAIVAQMNLGGVAIECWCLSPETHAIGLPAQNAVGIDLPVDIKLQARNYGTP